jgi:peptidoglycan/LPS O-acetylase OafA/YrhL
MRLASSRRSESLFSIQVLRVVAAMAVVLPHTHRQFELKFGLPDALPFEAFKVGHAGVDLFFVIFGFIMVYVSEKLFGPSGAPSVPPPMGNVGGR